MVRCIQGLAVRGAPLLGVAGAMCLGVLAQRRAVPAVQGNRVQINIGQAMGRRP
jgi:methylthioribose-1-phosphate isomerase